jgi:hypothetical protein
VMVRYEEAVKDPPYRIAATTSIPHADYNTGIIDQMPYDYRRSEAEQTYPLGLIASARLTDGRRMCLCMANWRQALYKMILELGYECRQLR